MNLKIWL